MVRGIVAAAAILIMTAGGMVSWAPIVEANCDKSYPPCICNRALSLPCSGPSFEELAGVAFSAHMERDTDVEGSAGYVVFTFYGAPEQGEVPFVIDLEASGVEWRDGDVTHYTHGNTSTATMVQVFQHFTSDEDPEVRFTLTAHEGTQREESVEGTLGYEAHGEEPDPEGGELTPLQLAIVSGAVGALLGAIVTAVVIMVARRS